MSGAAYEAEFRMLPGDVLGENDGRRSRDRWRWRRIRELREQACEVATLQRAPKLERARLVVTVSLPDRRRRDLHNFTPTIKALVDGLVDAGVLPDDDALHLSGPDWRLSAERSKRWMGQPTISFGLALYPIGGGQQ